MMESGSFKFKFEQSPALHQGLDLKGCEDNKCVQYIVGNTDLNTRALDGLGSFLAWE